MKGVIFTEFIEMIEDTFSIELAEHIIEQADLPSKGIYTSLGTYDHRELIQLVTGLSTATGMATPVLFKTFGRHLFHRFAAGFPHFFEETGAAFDFLENVETYIHVEVRKLYPEAELPSFTYSRPSPDQMMMEYRSRRPLADLAEGLIAGCIEYYGADVEVQREELSKGNEAGTWARFVLTKKGALL